MALDTAQRKTLSDLVFGETLSESTMKKRRNLIFTSAFSILLTVYDLKINKTPWLDIDVPTNTPNILHGAISVALVYFVVIFVVYAWEDFRRWRHANNLLHTHKYFDLTLTARQHLNTIAQHMDKIPIPNRDNPQFKAIGRHLDEADEFFEEVNDKVKNVYKDHQILGWVQWSRLLVLDLGTPLILSSIALYKIYPAITPFISAIFK
jgi:hypothetical protein